MLIRAINWLAFRFRPGVRHWFWRVHRAVLIAAFLLAIAVLLLQWCEHGFRDRPTDLGS